MSNQKDINKLFWEIPPEIWLKYEFDKLFIPADYRKILNRQPITYTRTLPNGMVLVVFLIDTKVLSN